MTDKNSENTELPTLESSSDDFLRMLIKIVNEGCVNFGVTLNVKGNVVSGTLINAKVYIDKFGEMFAKGLSRENPNQDLMETFSLDAESPSVSDFIHLDNATIHQTFNPEPMPSSIQAAALWIGRLSEIDGFILGELISS